jgi:hypothetical protein
MHMVGHVAVGVELRIAVVEDLPDDARQEPTIVRCEEDVLTMVATQRDVVQRARRMDAGRSRHSLPKKPTAERCYTH